MFGIQWKKCVHARLLPVYFAGLVIVNTGFAAVADSNLAVSPDGTSVDFEFREAPRREVFDRIFALRGIKLDWRSRAVADEFISGSFHGTLSNVARQLLAQTNFVVVYERADETSRIARVMVVGLALPEQSSANIAAVEAAMRSNGNPPQSANVGLPSNTPPPAGGPPLVPEIIVSSEAPPFPTPRSSDIPPPIPMSVTGPAAKMQLAPVPKNIAQPFMARSGIVASPISPPGSSKAVGK